MKNILEIEDTLCEDSELDEITDEEQEAFNKDFDSFEDPDFIESVKREARIEERRLNLLMKIIKSKVDKNEFADFIDWMKSASNSNFKITKKINAKQYEKLDDFVNIEILHDYHGGGYEGDSHSGMICVKISDRHYFQFYYSM